MGSKISTDNKTFIEKIEHILTDKDMEDIMQEYDGISNSQKEETEVEVEVVN